MAVLQACTLNAAPLGKGKERMEQGEGCRVNKQATAGTDLCCVTGVFVTPLQFSADDVAFAYQRSFECARFFPLSEHWFVL